MKTVVYGDREADLILVQMADGHDLETMESEVSWIGRHTEVPFCMIACGVDDWNRNLSPWEAPPVFGKEPFGSGADETLAFLLSEVLPAYEGRTVIIGGYSLAGLFALWAAYQTDAFRGVAAASPSAWFPGFVAYAEERNIRTEAVYLSLGEKEERTRNRTMSAVGDAVRSLHRIYSGQQLHTVLEWNPGGHFQEPVIRTAKAFAWNIQLFSDLDRI